MFMIPLSRRAASDSQSAALSLTPHEISERERERESGDAVHRGEGRERDRESTHSTVSSRRSADTHRKQDYSRLLSIEVSGEMN